MRDMAQGLPPLDPPGAGIPLLQKLFARYYLLPKYYRRMSWEAAQDLFDREGEKILRLSGDLAPAQLAERRLVEPMRGLEDSSRFWSVAMAMEHLIIVGDRMQDGILRLIRGENPDFQVSTAAFKPQGTTGGETRDPTNILTEYRVFLSRFREAMELAKPGRDSRLKLAHPWFGPMNAHEWHCLAGVHQNLHRKQMEAIISKLP